MRQSSSASTRRPHAARTHLTASWQQERAEQGRHHHRAKQQRPADKRAMLKKRCGGFRRSAPATACARLLPLLQLLLLVRSVVNFATRSLPCLRFATCHVPLFPSIFVVLFCFVSFGLWRRVRACRGATQKTGCGRFAHPPRGRALAAVQRGEGDGVRDGSQALCP